MPRVTTLTLVGLLEDALDPDVAQEVLAELAISAALQRRLARLRAHLLSREREDTEAQEQDP